MQPRRIPGDSFMAGALVHRILTERRDGPLMLHGNMRRNKLCPMSFVPSAGEPSPIGEIGIHALNVG